MKKYIYQETGFSLFELMIALAVLGFVLAGVTLMFTSTGRYHTGQEMMVEVTQNIRAARNLMVDEIRSAGCNPEGTHRFGFQISGNDQFNTDANSIHFTRDIDNGDGDEFYEPDGDANDPNEDVSYCRIDSNNVALAAGDPTLGTLVRNTGGGGQPVADNITNLQFQYYDSSNTLIDPANMTTEVVLDTVKSVQVTITGQVQNPNLVRLGNQTWTQQFRIRLRNL